MNDVIMFPSRLKYRIFREPTDLRNGIKGLSDIVYKHLGKGIRGEPVMFFFFNRSRKDVKALWHDYPRVFVLHCRLEENDFVLPALDPTTKTIDMEPARMMALLQGLRVYKIEPTEGS